MAAEVLQLIPTILVTRFRNKTIPEICAMGGLTLEDFTQSRAYQEIFGLGARRTLSALEPDASTGSLSDGRQP